MVNSPGLPIGLPRVGGGLLAKGRTVGIKASGNEPALPSCGPANIWGVKHVLVRVTITVIKYHDLE